VKQNNKLWIIRIWTKWQISVFWQMLTFLSFHLILTNGPILTTKNHQRVVFSWWILSRQVLGVCSIRILQKNMGNLYYEPTIVAHEKLVILKPWIFWNLLMHKNYAPWIVVYTCNGRLFYDNYKNLYFYRIRWKLRCTMHLFGKICMHKTRHAKVCVIFFVLYQSSFLD